MSKVKSKPISIHQTSSLSHMVTEHLAQRGVHYIEYDQAALADIGPTVMTLAGAEDLPSHGEAVRVRLA